jgi:hypothetical protein
MKITTRTLIPIIVLTLLALGAVGVASAQNFSDIAGTIRSAVTRQSTKEIEITGTITSITPETWTVDGTEFSVLPQTEVDGAFIVGDVVKVHLYTAADGSLVAREIEFAESAITNGNSNDNGEMDDDNGNVNANDNSEINDDNGNATRDDNGEIEEDDGNTNSNDNGEIEDDDDNANSNDNGSINENSNANDDDSNDNGSNINDNGNANDDDSNDDHAGDHGNGNSNDHHSDDDHGGGDHDGGGGNDNGGD